MNTSRVSSRRAILTASIGALLGLVATGSAQTVYWDPTGDGNGAIGGPGTWNLTPLWDPTGTDLLADNIAWPNSATAVGIFGGAGGVVTINTGSGVTANRLVFGVSGYTIASNVAADVLTFAGATPTIEVTNAGHAARINSIIAGSAGLRVTGAGSLVLAGANTHTGITVVDAGVTVSLSAAGALGATGVGNETIVNAGGTLNVGGQAVSNNPAPGAVTEIIQIAGHGVDGIGALINTGAGQINALGKVVLTADARLSAGSGIATSYNTGGQIVTSAGGRFDIRRNAAPTAGQAHLDLAGFTLLKTGTNLFALVNADVSSGDIVVDEGQLNFEAGTLVQGSGTITVNPNGKLGFWSVSNAGNITRQIIVNGGTVGDPTSTGAAQTVNAPIQFTGAQNPTFTAISTNRTTLGGLISQSAFTGTGLDKRGPGLLTFSNPANSFSAPITIHAGTLGADFIGALSGGVPPAAALISTDTPLGTNSTITLAGGTLAIRANMDNNNSNQVFDLQRAIVVDRAPSAMTFDRITNTTQTDKHVRITSLTFAPASADNGYSIGQNLFTFTQANTHRLEIPLLTMNRDTVLASGDHTLTGNVVSSNRHSLGHSVGSTIQFIAPGTHDFNAFFNLGGSLRIGTGFGTPTTNDTVTVGTGNIYIAPGAGLNVRTATNLAAGQVIDATIASQLVLPMTNFQQFTAIPAALRARGSGIYGIGSATYTDLDLSAVGNGTWRIGAGIAGSGTGVINGKIAPGTGNVIRMGGGGTVTVNGVNSISGSALFEVGSALLNNAQTTSGTGTVVVTAENNHSGGTLVNRGSTLAFQHIGALGSGIVEAFGIFTAQGAGGTFTADDTTNVFTPNLYGGSTLSLNNGAVTGTTNINRWGDEEPVVLRSSSLTHTSRNDNTSTSTEQIGDLVFAGGSFVNVNRQNAVAGNVSELIVNGLVRIEAGTLEAIRTTGTGAGWGGGQLFRVSGAAPTVVNGMVAPWMVQQDNGVLQFVNYTTNGFVPATYDATVTTGTYGAGTVNFDGVTGGKLNVTTAALTLTDDPILYALRTDQAINASGANDVITLRSGGLIGNANTGTTTIAPALVFNNGTSNIEALINQRTGGNLNLTGTVTANGLTKFGAGIVSLHANNGATLSGVVSVNAGTLQLHGPSATGTHNVAGTSRIELQGGQLNLRSHNSAVTGTINPTLQAGVVVGANIPTATIDLNRSGADTASSGTFIFNPAAADGPGLTLQGSPGPQGQTLNVSGANYAIQFGSNGLNSFTGNVTINNAVTVTLNTNPTIMGVNPVITKSGAGTLIVGPAFPQPASVTVAPNTKVVVNGGTLELRSIFAFGNGSIGNTSLVLNTGTLNLRRDSAGDYGGSTSTAYPVTINGNVTLSTDRVGGTNTNFREGLGTITMNGSPTLTVNNGNGIYPEIFGTVDGTSMVINGMAFIASNVAAGSVDSALRLNSAVVGGGLVKLGSGHLHLMSANTYSGGTHVNQGILRARAANALGNGPVYLNPGATIDFNNAANLGSSQPLIVRSNGAFLPMISVNVNGVSHPTMNVNTTHAPEGIVGISNGTGGSYDVAVDLSSLYGGGWSFGGISAGAYDPVFTGSTLIAGNDGLYRLGGGGTSFAMGTDAGRTARENVLTGPNNVRLGFDSGNLRPANQTMFQFSIAGVNDYSGGSTVIHRGMVARLFASQSGGRSGFSDSAVDVFGVFGLGGQGSLDNGAANVNAVTFHPGSALFLDNTNGAANNTGAFAAANLSNRWNDAAPIALNGAMINLIGVNEGASSETLGDVTFSRGARIRSARTNAATNPSLTATSELTLNSLTRTGPGSTLMLQTAAAGSLNAATNYDRIIVANGAPVPVNGMVAPYIVNGSDHTFVTYGANGFSNVVFDSTVTATPLPANLGANAKVDVNAAAGVALSDNASVYALRTNRDITVAGPFNTVTIGSGGLIGHANTTTVTPHLVFHDGTSEIEALIYNSTTMNINGTLRADGITKFGVGNLSINVPQKDYASGWTINSGTLQINDLEGLGQSVAENTVTLNPTLSTGGQASQAFGISNLTFNRNQGTAELQTFTGGPIAVINEGTVRVAGGDDRQLQIPSVTLISTSTASSVGFTFDVPNNRFRATIPELTLNSDAVIRVFDSGATTDTGRVTTGAVTQLVGDGKNLVKIGNRTLELPGDNSATFEGGSMTISQGTVRVRHNGSLGSAATTITVQRNATLEIDTPDFDPIAAVTQLPGSIERWNREDVRGATHNLPAGVNLQLNTNLIAARTIGLNGGSLEGFHWIDHSLAAVERTVGAAVTINLLSDSFVGQNILQGQGYDAGRQPTTNQPFGDNVTGAFLRIEGNITGAFNLTKTGFDTVTLAGAANAYGDTTVDLGILRLGRDNALPITGGLTTRLNGTLDLFGHNQVVSRLGTADLGSSPGGTGVGSSGRITNSGTTNNTLLVNGIADSTYNGVIEQNVSLTKIGGSTLTLGGANTYRGDTTISDGTVNLLGSISGTKTIDVHASGILDVTLAAGGFVLGTDQTLTGTGVVLGPVLGIDGTVAPGAGGGTLSFNGLADFRAGSGFSVAINSPTAFDQLSTFGAVLGGPVNLSLGLGFTPDLGAQFVILENTSTNPIGGTGLFAWSGPEGLLLEGEEFLVDSTAFTITYVGGVDNNDVILTAVPEPGSAVMLLGGLALLAGRRRRA